jgi:hypothetical protein
MRDGQGTFTFAEIDGKGSHVSSRRGPSMPWRVLSPGSASVQWAGSYTGEWAANKKHGQGVFMYPNGDKYSGTERRGGGAGLGAASASAASVFPGPT